MDRDGGQLATTPPRPASRSGRLWTIPPPRWLALEGSPRPPRPRHASRSGRPPTVVAGSNQEKIWPDRLHLLGLAEEQIRERDVGAGLPGEEVKRADRLRTARVRGLLRA